MTKTEKLRRLVLAAFAALTLAIAAPAVANADDPPPPTTHANPGGGGG